MICELSSLARGQPRDGLLDDLCHRAWRTAQGSDRLPASGSQDARRARAGANRKGRLVDMVSIHDRTHDVVDRLNPGDWCGLASEFGSEALSLRVECPILVSLIWMSSDQIWGAKPSTLGPIAARQVIAQTWRAANNFFEFSPVSHFCNQCPGLAKADPYLSCVASRSTMLAVASFMPMISTSML